ncbi:MAG: TolC family protein [Planctomycetes bacterium]|nr:TolC family protein [Planctomycetota bacterium]
MPSRSPRSSASSAAWFLGLCPVLAAPRQEPPAASVQGSERVLQLTLEDALRIVLRNNFGLEIERLVTEAASYDALGSWGAFDPVFSATGSASQSETEQTNSFAGASVVEGDDLRLSSSLVLPLTSGGSIDLSFDHINSKTNSRFASFDVSTTDVLTAALTQPLLRGAWRRYATSKQRASEIVLARQRERERETRALVLLDVYNAYWNLVSAEKELAVRELAVDLGQKQLAQDQRRLEVGAGTEVDVLQSETNVAQQEELRVRADYSVRQARDSLRRMLAPRPEGDYEAYLAAWDWPIQTLTTLPEADVPQSLDWRSSLRLAIERRPELAQRRLDIDSAELALLRARSERQARLDLSLSTSSAGFDSDPNNAFDKAAGWDFPSSTAALTFSLPLWNRSARNAENSVRSSLRGARLQYDSLELDLLAEVRTAVNEVDKQRETVGAAIKSRNLAQRQLEAEQTRQEVGLSTTFQVLQFQEDLAQALSTEVLAKAAYAKAQARLVWVEGRLGEDLEPQVEGR